MERNKLLRFPSLQYLLKGRSSLQNALYRSSLSYPSRSELDRMLAKSVSMPFSYETVGATQTQAPKGYDFDENKKRVGLGFFAFKTAKRAFKNWEMFHLGWISIYRGDTDIQAGQNVVVSFRLFGLWWHNTCEIVYTVNEPRRFGFAYGTKYHVESGEELFMIHIDDDQTVWYDITAFSRPQFWMTKMVYPMARFFQRRFVKQSGQHMESIIKSNHGRI